MLTLGIETSCDETGLGLYHGRRGLLGHVLASQVDLHAPYGGVVPELASRDHVRKLLPLLRTLLAQTGTRAGDIDTVAYTAGPGLVGALLTGATVARALAWAWRVPCVGVHHMEAHLLAALLEAPDDTPVPFVALLVSGGHTLLVEVAAIGRYRVLGQSLDDAVGEAFDKTAKLLGLPYPGGPALARLARQASEAQARRFQFTRPMINRPGLDFSFSGLKTQVRQVVRELESANQAMDLPTRAAIARAFEEAVVQTLVIKCRRALQQTGARSLLVAGGVSANQRLRQQLAGLCAEHGWRLRTPAAEYCTDNGAMVAFAGHLRSPAQVAHNAVASAPCAGHADNAAPLVRARWPLADLPPLPGRSIAPPIAG